MALTRALGTGGSEQIEDSETTVTSARAENLKAFLPEIDDGTGTTVDDGYQVLVSANSTGDIEIVDVFGARVGMVQSGEVKAFLAMGDATLPYWVVTPMVKQIIISNAEPSSGSTTPALGTTCGASSGTVKWIRAVLADGTAAFIPCWS